MPADLVWVRVSPGCRLLAMPSCVGRHWILLFYEGTNLVQEGSNLMTPIAWVSGFQCVNSERAQKNSVQEVRESEACVGICTKGEGPLLPPGELT